MKKPNVEFKLLQASTLNMLCRILTVFDQELQWAKVLRRRCETPHLYLVLVYSIV